MAKGKITKKSEVPDPGVLGFFGIDPVTDAIKASRFDVQEEIEIIITHVRDGDPKVSLPALKHLRTVLKEVAAANGLFGTVQQTRSVEDKEGKVTKTLSTNTLLSNLMKENENDKTQDGYEVLSPIEKTNHVLQEPLPKNPGGSGGRIKSAGTDGAYDGNDGNTEDV